MAEARHYEVLFILDPRVEDAKIQAALERYLGVVTQRGATVNKVDHWGRRKFAYEMKHLNEGYYALASVQAEPSAMDELDRVLRLQDELVRHKITRPGKD
jgi:small subunit ribosomal protein S6